jgi:hypothetical protein
LSAGSNELVGVLTKNGKNLGAVGGREMSGARTNGEFAFAGSAAVTKIFDYFRAEGFHWQPASNPFG